MEYKKQNKNKLIDSENRLLVTRREGVERENAWTHLYSSCFISTICQMNRHPLGSLLCKELSLTVAPSPKNPSFRVLVGSLSH